MANSFWQREKGMKKMNSTSFVFKVWKTRKLKKAFAKEEEKEEVQNLVLGFLKPAGER